MTAVDSSLPSDSVWVCFFQINPSFVQFAEEIRVAWLLLAEVLDAGGQVLVCGNGGSASDSEHIAGELVKPCAIERPLSEAQQEALRVVGDDGHLGVRLQNGLPVMPLVSQAALLTAIVNDQGGDLIFAQQVMAYGRAKDLLWVLSTSGNSINLVHALRTAKAIGMRTVGFTGPMGGAISGLCDVELRLPGESVAAVQQSHQIVYHALCLAIEADRYTT